jgi:hypothetical protein
MTVNTLGNPIDRSSRSVAEWLWPFLLGCVSVFCISALVYYHVRWDVVEPRSALQVVIAAVYRWFGLAPSVLFFLLVGTWSSIWLVAGSLDRLGVRLLRLVAMAVMLGVFLNLGDGGVVPAVHKGEVGAWLAGRLVAVIGYPVSLGIVWITTFAALLLATEFFFSDRFEQLRSADADPEVGVEAAVTDHLRGLGAATSAPGSNDPESAAAGGEHEAFGEAADAGWAAPTPAPTLRGDAEPRRVSYFERRLRRTAESETDADGYLDAVPRVGASFEEPPVAEPVVDDEVFVRPADAPGAAASAADEPRDDDAIDLLGPPASDADVVEPAGSAEAESEVDVASWIGGDADTETDLAAHGDWPPTSGEAPPAAEHGAVEWMASESEAPSDRVAAEEPTAAESAAEVFAADEEGAPVADASAHEQRTEAEPVAAAADPSADDEPAAEEPSAEDVRAEELAAEELAAEAPVPIPRPELPVAPRVPTPPAVARDAEHEHPSGSRQQRLFGGRIDDALVQEAIDTVVGARRASASLLQRKLRVDYELACDLLAELDARGVVTLDGDRAHGRLRQE